MTLRGDSTAAGADHGANRRDISEPGGARHASDREANRHAEAMHEHGHRGQGEYQGKHRAR